MIDLLLFSLPTEVVIGLIVLWPLGILGAVLFCSIGGVADRRIERMDRRMAELNRSDVAERSRQIGGWRK